MTTDGFDDNPLEPAEELDSDEIRNDDGDEVVDPPERWIDAKDDETLDQRLAEEEPDVSPDDRQSPADALDADAADRIDPDQHGRSRGQIDGTPEDGESFFDVVE